MRDAIVLLTLFVLVVAYIAVAYLGGKADDDKDE